MTSQYEMQFPFTSRQEILDWKVHYIEVLSKKRQNQEQAVIDIKKKVETRKTPETPQGYLCHSELWDMAKWKHHFTPSKIDKNCPGYIKEITGEAFRLDDDWEKIKKLEKIYGVAESVASVILHFYDRKKYPILDHHALRSVGIKEEYVHGPKYPFWQEYVNFCREKAECYDVSMRTLDRALWKFSESGAALALKFMANETLFLELKRRGYPLSKLRD